MRARVKLILIAILVLFLLPIAARAALFMVEDRPRSWRDADWSSVGMLPKPAEHRDARLLVFSGRTGGLKGLIAVHSWIVLKREGAQSWARYDVVGWGSPVRLNGWAADGRWYGDIPHVVVDVRGAEAAALIPKVEAAVKEYRYAHAGDYRMWPGPNSNTFVATILRAVPELGVALPPNAIGKDFRDEGFYLGFTDSRTGIELNLWSLLGIKLGWVEGFEINVLGLVVGLDLRQPALKLPGFGRLGFGFPVATALSADAREKAL
jgi:Protein of unknown function (DUF3750)